MELKMAKRDAAEREKPKAEELSVDQIMAQKAQKFFEAYTALVQEHGFHMDATAGLKPQPDGAYGIVVGINVITSNDGRFRFPLSNRGGGG
jgi:hypothetical protein